MAWLKRFLIQMARATCLPIECEKRYVEEKDVRKKLEEMNLLDDFLFGSVVSYSEIGEGA